MPKYEGGHVWTEEKDGRMPYERSSPMHFAYTPTKAYARGFDSIDWSDGPPNQAKARKVYPHVKSKGRF